VRATAQACGNHLPDAIALTGATRTTAFLDAQGAGLAPLMKWNDASATVFANTLRAALLVGTADLGGALAYHPISRMLWFIEQTIEHTKGQLHVLEMKDALNLALCGVMACDPVTQARQAFAGTDTPALLARLGLAPQALPPARPSASVLGMTQVASTHAWHRFNGVPVIECGFDAWCATLGMGAVQPGSAYNECGSTDVFGTFAAQHPQLPGVSDLLWACGLRHLGGPCTSGLGTLAWFGRQYLGNEDPAVVLACAQSAQGEVPLCVPFVAGERMPYWRNDLTASFLGVQRHHGVAHLARALVDGLLVFNGWLLNLLNPNPVRILLGGGGAHLPSWAGLKAAAFGAPVHVSANNALDASLQGAAACGCTALGEFATLDLAQAAMAVPAEQILPDETQLRRLQEISTRLLPHFPAYPATAI
jgi:xylulokinase